MKNIIFLLASALLFSNCKNLKFEQPLPNGGQEMKSLPSALAGIYQQTGADRNILQEGTRIEYIAQDQIWNVYSEEFVMASKLKSSEKAFVRNDSLFRVEPGCDSCSPLFLAQVKRVGERYVASTKLLYHMELSKSILLMYNEKDGTRTDYALVLRKKGELYFFNVKEEGQEYWYTTTLQQTPRGIRVQFLGWPNGEISDLPFKVREEIDSTSLRDEPHTAYVANPSDRQLAKFLRNKNLLESHEFLRMEEKK
ncbi:MAG: hypothetical protein ACKVT2_22580 [Saprospiraceae bacterium]